MVDSVIQLKSGSGFEIRHMQAKYVLIFQGISTLDINDERYSEACLKYGFNPRGSATVEWVLYIEPSEVEKAFSIAQQAGIAFDEIATAMVDLQILFDVVGDMIQKINNKGMEIDEGGGNIRLLFPTSTKYHVVGTIPALREIFTVGKSYGVF